MKAAKVLTTTERKKPGPSMEAKEFLKSLVALSTKKEIENIKRFFTDKNQSNKFLGVRMADIFGLSKMYSQLPLKEIELLLESEYYEARMGAVSIMDFQARNKNITEDSRKKLFNLYTSRHERINNWDLVDRSAPYVVGGYLFDKRRTVLYKLAKSKNVWERRTAIVSTYYFIRQNDLDDTFKIAELLIEDKHDLIHKAVGSWLREAGKRDEQKLITFLDKFAATMPRTSLRYAIEKLGKKQKDHYMNCGR